MTDPKMLFTNEAIPDEPGWFTWDLHDSHSARFNEQVMGALKVKREGDKCRLRMMPTLKHSNLLDMVHGAATLSLIDISLFAAMHLLGSGDAKEKSGPSVTLELSTQFIGAGQLDQHLDAVTEILRETRGLVFLRGEVVQEDVLIAAFSGVIRKLAPK